MGDVTLVLREGREDALDTKTFVFDAEGLSGAQPGQYLMVKLEVPDDPRRGARSFTMANGPSEGRVIITTRIRSGSPFKRRLASLAPGDRLEAKGPFGRFVLHDGDAPALFLGGGIGVTPFRSMVKHAIDTGRDAPVFLLTSDRVPEAIPFRAELDAWASAYPWLHVARTITRPQEARVPWPGRMGRIDEDWVREHVSALDRAIAYVCGAPRFVEGVGALLASMGVPPDRVRMERFIGY